MDAKEIIFVIEDDKNYLDIYDQALNSQFNLLSFTNAKDALEKFKVLQPKTILLDLNLPDLNGIEFCATLFDKYCSPEDIDIIFVTGEVDPKFKLMAFEVGASDYLTKPFEIRELVYKVKSSIERKLKEEQLASEALESKKLINTTMEQASQYSQVMSFFKNLAMCKNIDEVAQTFFESMEYFGVVSSLHVKLPTDSYFRQDGSPITPIEKEVYDLLQSKGRLYEFSNRIIVNDAHLSFIIKNPPKDPNKMGQLRDYTAAMVEGLEAKVLEIYAQSSMQNAILDLSSNITELKTGVNKHNQLINSVMSNMMIEIAGSYHELEMTETQETFLNKLIETGSEQLSHAEDVLVDIMSKLEALKVQMENVQQAVTPRGLQVEDNNDIELF